MRITFVALLFIVAGCGGKESKNETPPPIEKPAPPPNSAANGAAIDAAVAAVKPAEPTPAPAPQTDPPAAAGYDFTPIAKELLVVGACGEGTIPEGFSEDLVKTHCAAIDKTQTAYVEGWLKIARPFIAERVPKDLPKKVVYPFAGGDLSTA